MYVPLSPVYETVCLVQSSGPALEGLSQTRIPGLQEHCSVRTPSERLLRDVSKQVRNTS